MCCCPKKEGDLRIKNLCVLNEALLSKLAASVHSTNDRMLLFLKQRFLNDANLSRVIVFSIWGSLRHVYMNYFKNAFWLLGENSVKSFWHDNWIGGIISDWVQVPSACRKLFQGSVSNYLHDGGLVIVEFFLYCFP